MWSSKRCGRAICFGLFTSMLQDASTDSLRASHVQSCLKLCEDNYYRKSPTPRHCYTNFSLFASVLTLHSPSTPWPTRGAPPTSPSTVKPSGIMRAVKALVKKNTQLLIIPHTRVRRPPRQQPRVRRRDEVRRQAAVLEAAEAVLQHFDEDVVHRGVVALS
jgi:hypothetical protein